MKQKVITTWKEIQSITRQTFITLYAFGALIGWIVIVSKAREVFEVITK